MTQEEKTKELIELNRPLIEAHPFLVPLWAREPDSDYDGSFTIKDLAPKGWGDLIVDMCSEIEAYAKESGLDVTQMGVYDIKEKYGELRIEAGGPQFDAKCQDIVDSYCEKSLLVCPSCGKPTKYITSGYVLYLCPECAKQTKLPSRPLTAEDVPYYTYYEYDEETHDQTKKYTRPTHHDAVFRAQWNGEETDEG